MQTNREKLESIRKALNEMVDPKLDPIDVDRCFRGECDNPDCGVCDAIHGMREVVAQSAFDSASSQVTDKQRAESDIAKTVHQSLMGRDDVDSCELWTVPGTSPSIELCLTSGYQFEITIEQTNADEG